MINILYEDNAVIVVEKPVGMESQVVHSFEPDMVSEIRKHINKLFTTGGEPYVGVIHRLDKPVGGVMVYAKTINAASNLSSQLQKGQVKKKYQAVLCGKPVDIVGNFVDYLLKDAKSNYSRIVDKGITGGKRAELNYRILGLAEQNGQTLTLAEVELVTGRHHQIRVQFAGHGLPLWGDNKYNLQFSRENINSENNIHKNCNIALFACELSFFHPETKKKLIFTSSPKQDIFEIFKNSRNILE